jgi:predicted anti-sigma-YlaC factor YlaD
MDCHKFQDSISDYLDGVLDPRTRAECATHRLICRECRELYTDVRTTVQTLNSVAHREIDRPEGLNDRIIAATTAGEMLSCGDFDKIIERYFDGVILAPTFQTLQAHFEKCTKCRRLMVGIEDAIAMCREIKEVEVEVPESLHDRIVAATVGAKEEDRRWTRRVLACLSGFCGGWANVLLTPQMGVAALIFAASGLLILSRFGSVSGMASHAGSQAEILVNQGHRAINQTGAIARTGFRRVSYEVNTFLFDGGAGKSNTNYQQVRPVQTKTMGQTPPQQKNTEPHPDSVQGDQPESGPIKGQQKRQSRPQGHNK